MSSQKSKIKIDYNSTKIFKNNYSIDFGIDSMSEEL